MASARKKEITSEALQYRRFELLQGSLQLSGSFDQMSSVYLEQLAICSELMEEAEDVFRALHRKSRIAIITNGLRAVQRSRLAHSTIRYLITDIIISEEIGAAKPQAAFFDIAFSRLGHPAKSEVLIIGDSLSSDMPGGVNYGLDTCWFNPAGEPRPQNLAITHEIRHLHELLDILA